MPYSRNVLDLRRDLLSAAVDGYFPRDKLLSDARKAVDGMVPYSGLGARSANDYFPSLEIPGAQRTSSRDYSHVDTSLAIGGRYSSSVITADVPFFVAGMSYGSLKLPTKVALHLALNRLAEAGIRVIMNTGEGSALPWELYGTEAARSKIPRTKWETIMEGTDRLLEAHQLGHLDRKRLFTRSYPLVTQYASGRFWKPPEYVLNADGIEIKIGQGAKIGHGGLLPGAKVTELVAESRGIPPYKAAHSPSRHLNILGPEDLVATVLRIREETEWRVPVIVKVGASRVFDDMLIILKSVADAAAIDGLVGGTGAAPWEVREVIGINTIPSIGPAKAALAEYYATRPEDHFKYLVHGGVWDSERMAKCMALGADGVGVGTGFLLAMGCTLVQECYTNECPAGLTGSYEKLDIPASVDGIVNYVRGTRRELQTIAGSLGRSSTHFTRGDVVATDEMASIVTGLPFADGSTYRDVIRRRIESALNGRSEALLQELYGSDGHAAGG